ncbi:MAG: amidohydrolase [Planctomycetota bacterium]
MATSQLTPILDTHQHLVYADRWPYSWTASIPALAGKSCTVNDYRQDIAGTGIAATLFMETSPDDPHWIEETKHVAKLSGEPESLISGLIANCRPENDNFEAYLDSLDGLPIVGLRRILHVEPDEVSQQPRFVRNVGLLAARGWTFDICMFQRQLSLAAVLARQCPDVQFVLDHCGVPDIVGGSFDDWRQKIRQVAEMPNVACKISGIMAYCKPGEATVATVRPYIEHCLDVFSWNRVVWGSDWPVCRITVPLSRWVETTREIIAGESEENQRKLLYANAIRLYRIPKADPRRWPARKLST